MLEIADIAKSFGGVEVIRPLSLRVASGERLVILGPNGAGKTTLMRLIAGEIAPDRGCIRLNGRDVTALPADARARAGLGRGFQRTSLFDGFSLRENLILAAASAAGRTGPGRDPLRDAALEAKAREAARLTHLSDLDRPVAAADHGTRRRLDLAMALAGAPRLLLLDEPASGIGAGGAEELHGLIAGLPRALTMIVIEHDLDLAFAIADRIAVMDRGALIYHGAPEGARAVLRAIYDA
ncbi:ABC transporter ATP-binding protein [Paracoccus sp. SCSIO 75233]|uniref:ABC transporter ATP-binding protein n=1 Tax=Paracoccus sp. SCSIO 75233 TaxID=3017782 RepID=UPI0022F082EF|nr:ATP-binding cassette domain-containing protein [Paracoccus sp. SCSIO 75233]WBU53220.1 ATP-binding cassette domain-containing protein [Paracoccus sp. SCSIO 75233]